MYRVFLIDDEPWAIVSLEHLLDWQSLGFEIAGKIDTARTAWDQIQRERPDVIITDIRMPGLSGLELLSLVHESGLPISVVLVSAFADFTYAQEAIRKGAFEYLLKPVRRDKLTACIQQLREQLDLRSAQRGQEDEARRRELFSRAATAREAYEALGGTEEGEIALLHGGAELDALLSWDKQGPSWPRVALGDGETAALAPWSSELPDCLLTLCREKDYHGVFGLAHGSGRLDTLKYQARNAYLTARFIGADGMIVTPETEGYAQGLDLFKALQYNQRDMVLTHLEALRRETEAGHVLLDKLFGLMQNLDSFYRHAQDKSALFSAEWKQPADLLRDYPSCSALFDYLLSAFAGDPDEALLTPVLREIETHYACNRTLSDLGQELGVSQAHLSQLIRRHTGKTYSELVQEKRMEKAKELLAYSETAVMDIAVEVGYSDQFYFSKLFKRLWGLSPAAWRKKVRSGNEITKTEMK